jgi:hypothetical protein
VPSTTKRRSGSRSSGPAEKKLYIFFKPFTYVNGQKIALDGETLNYTLHLGAIPSSAVVTDVTGSTTELAPTQSLILPLENTPKFLEIAYP